MSILIFGGDGYIGWPLAMRVARLFPGEKIVLVDNLTRRALVKELGSDSVTPILSLPDRIAAFKRRFGPVDIEWVRLDVTSPEVDDLVALYKPRLVFHLAQIGSAAYSMRGPEESIRTLTNNEGGNLRILWAVRRHVPDAHFVKSGSFGTYAKCGTDIPEGYFFPEYGGRRALTPAPFPRQADDAYHVSKINDTNYISLACRKWGMRVTDVMQSTIFGLHTEETRVDPDLITRFDYDEYFGTVVNRFLAQTAIGRPMTVFGTGWQRTGLMALEDALASIGALAKETPARGQHRVVNHVTEKSFCIREVALEVQRAARKMGYAAEIELSRHNPRGENDTSKLEYGIDTAYVASRVSRVDLPGVLEETLRTVAENASRIDPARFEPRTAW